MQYLLTFLEGIITFISPCLLPLLPVYIAYFSGDAYRGSAAGSTGADAGASPLTGADSADRADGAAVDGAAVSSSGADAASAAEAGSVALSTTKQTLLRAIIFVCGFTFVFALLGALAGSIGVAFVQHRRLLDIVCGVFVIIMGVHYTGIINIPLLSRVSAKSLPESASWGQAFIFGAVFAISWTPCVGAFLASALSLAATSAHVLEGVALLVCFSLGLGIPFIISALVIHELAGAFTFIKQHYRIITIASGILLILMGIAIATGYMTQLLSAVALFA